MESGTFRDTFDTLRHVTNPHGIRVPSSVFLLSGGLHNESTQKVAGAPGVAEELFEARQSALAMEKGKSDERPMLYTCRVCGKGYRSSKAHEQHCKSWRHVLRVSQGTASNGDEDVEADSDEELADADEEEASDSLSKLNVNEPGAEGLLTYLGLKVKRDFMCLYCSDLCHAFSSLEAVRKHMEAKIHCKLHYSDKKRS
ncbi:unnamed protein product [Brassica napus]|uniref:(rape) hypothetical protein n=1 Tax=Brassica napus TaxID=3708 RepID=A0A816I3Z9_BRANA|nr:unnamed protein product [Brassica napus]